MGRKRSPGGSFLLLSLSRRFSRLPDDFPFTITIIGKIVENLTLLRFFDTLLKRKNIVRKSKRALQDMVAVEL